MKRYVRAVAFTVLTVSATVSVIVFALGFDPRGGTSAIELVTSPGLLMVAVSSAAVAACVTLVVSAAGLFILRRFPSLDIGIVRYGLPTILGAVAMPSAWQLVFGRPVEALQWAVLGAMTGLFAGVAFWRGMRSPEME